MRRRGLILLGAVALLAVASTAAAQAPPTTTPAAPPTTAAPVTTAVPRGGIPAPPTLRVEPSSGLVDGQVVTISGEGWGNPIGPYLCGELVGDISRGCIRVGQVDAGVDGELHGTATLPARFTRPDGETVDCFVEQCRVLVTEFRGNGQVVLVSFAGVIPATPAFTG